ncbi:imidazole glycerol phosphate synthase subunit HisH [Texcoconibacillus texcoconensis]|uniref:Imidazole glycerol phosphate synthase subunit HisH n=1 Tax=Texcoconibacillus texcoconensis TaxID=1095777 RepID=A0A840QPZ1_9BACI|nr:imidazole glycerol phosphate synthase subunit HisH [Texcoconibacillus texcoconensis]MBB5173444.1 glutamine amidotransferase [Texcoconibacillus texcoconensis]
MIGVVDYGMGNLHSVSRALERLGHHYFISGDAEELVAKSDGLILPGVGAFPDAMKELDRQGLTNMLKTWANDGRPLLGICLGMQLLLERSEEHGHTTGLCLLPGHVYRFSGETSEGTTYKVPHMGWNLLRYHKEDHPMLQEVEPGHVYFVHSYVASVEEDVLIASAEYDVLVPAVIGRENVWGTQFHPEKSSDIGMRMLKNFAKAVEEGSGRV